MVALGDGGGRAGRWCAINCGGKVASRQGVSDEAQLKDGESRVATAVLEQWRRGGL